LHGSYCYTLPSDFLLFFNTENLHYIYIILKRTERRIRIYNLPKKGLYISVPENQKVSSPKTHVLRIGAKFHVQIYPNLQIAANGFDPFWFSGTDM
jgi:hypothetical protein